MPHIAVTAALLLGVGAQSQHLGSHKAAMNPVDYRIANPLMPNSSIRGFRGDFFEFYGAEIQTRYSEVHWSGNAVPLPTDIVKRFDGKVMAITGVETDIVRRSADGTDKSVPCYEQYNHHYSGWMHGKAARLLQKPQEMAARGHMDVHHMAMDSHTVSQPSWGFAHSIGSGIPRVQVFSEGNGNEHQGSYRGYASGIAQLIESPVTFLESPMIINTNKRLTKDTSPGHINNQLLPRKSLAPAGASYSGLAECPCTSRIPKILDIYVNQSNGSCASPVESPEECGAAWKKVGGRDTNVTRVHSSSVPPGCSAWYTSEGLTVVFNFRANSDIAHCQPGRVCICRDPKCTTGSIAGTRFQSPCAPYPTSDLIKTHNAICDVRAYNGGLRCCAGGAILLDADQEVPPQKDSFFMKYRFYFEEYTTQRNAFRVWWSTEAMNNEYDVPKSSANCTDPATPVKDCQHVIRSVFHGVDMLSLGNGCMMQGDINACGNVTRIMEEDGGQFELVYAGAHCHAPACDRMELWNADTGELLCQVKAMYGKEAACEFALPPCVWGTEAEGLKPPPVLRLSSNLTVVKYANNTNGHWGTMALWQMRAAYITKPMLVV